MKRKSFRDRGQALLSVERDRWKDFIDLCDKERKSVAYKFDEMIAAELQKNALGDQTPISIRYGEPQNKPSFQTNLTSWISYVDTVGSQQELSTLKGQAQIIARRIDQRSMILYKQGIKK